MKKFVFLLGSLIAFGSATPIFAGPRLEACKRVLSKLSSIAVPAAAEIGLGGFTGLIRTTLLTATTLHFSNKMIPNVKPYKNSHGYATAINEAIDRKQEKLSIPFYCISFIFSEALRHKISQKLKETKETPAPVNENECADKQSKTKFEQIRSFIPTPSLSFITSMMIEALSHAGYIYKLKQQIIYNTDNI